MAILLTRRTASIRATTLIAVVATAVAMLGACNETRRSLGEDCLKGDDCVSAICSSQRCAEAPPVLEASVVADASTDIVVKDAAPSTDANDGAAPPDGEAADANDGAVDGD